jgi:hypothetical protein
MASGTAHSERLAADVHDPHLHRLDRWHGTQLAIAAAEAYGRLLNIHELQVELDRTRSQLAALQAQWRGADDT